MDNWDSLVVSLWCGKYDTPDYIDKNIKTYRTFGNHDIITIAPITGDTATERFKGMWQQTNMYSQNIKAGESIHNLFAISDEASCSSFWKLEAPYLFISAIQINFDNNETFENQLIMFRDELKLIFEKEGFKSTEDFVIYNSLDCGDILLFIKTDRYNAGANAIHKMTIKSTHKHYSYSVCGIDANLAIESTSKDDEVIPKVVLCSVLADATNYNDWFQDFAKEYPNEFPYFDSTISYSSEKNVLCSNEHIDEYIHLSRLGNEDICINIFNCKINHLLKMLYTDTGVFCNKNEVVASAFSRLRIMFDTSISDMVPTEKRKFTLGTSLIHLLDNKWKDTLKEYSNPYVHKAICEMLAATENLENKGFAYDVQDCIRNVFPLFVEKINLYNKYQSEFSSFNFNNDLIIFTTGLMSIANGSLHADKLFINVPGFNAVTCDAPAKLLVYYTAYIQKIVTILNDNINCDYRFLLCPDLYLGIEIVPLFNYEKNGSQLLKARIPINKLFDPQKLLMELSHEAAHFVGDGFRKRKDRVCLLAKTIAYTFADRIVRPKMMNKLEFDYDNAGHLGENTIVSSFIQTDSEHMSIDYMLSNQWKEIVDFIQEELLIGVESTESLYLDDVHKLIERNARQLFVDTSFNKLSNKVCEVITESCNVDDVDKMFLLSKIVERHITEILLDEYEQLIDRACLLFSESFADLVMLCITKDPVLYLKNIFESEVEALYKIDSEYAYPWKYYLIGEMRLERIISVLSVLGYSIDEFEIDTDSRFNSFINSLKEYTSNENENERATSILSIKTNIEYLSLCYEELKNKGKELDEMSELYHSVTETEDLNSFIKSFRKGAFEFRTEMVNNIIN